MRIASLLLWLLLAIGLPACTSPQTDVAFTDSALPLLLLDTEGQTIRDEPKITAHLSVLDAGAGQRNRLTDAPTGYDGAIGIELRGATSQERYPKKQYGVETRDATGANLDVELLGLPPENDWVLHAPYGDKTLVRNALAYRLARRLGHYASRTRFCEVFLDSTYQGVYVLMEKVKRDDHRLALHKPEPLSGDLTGGYLFKIDKRVGSEIGGWRSPVPAPADEHGGHVFYQYHDPEPTEATDAQRAYLKAFVTTFEEVMASNDYADPETGYPALLNLDSFVDFVLLNELAKNVDGYRLSTYLYKDNDAVDGRLHAGPLWDFNLAFGNADYYDAASPEGLRILYVHEDDPNPVPFWWARLYQSPPFRTAAARRWATLRQGAFHTDSLFQSIDAMVAELGDAPARNFERWPILDEAVWPNSFIGETYEAEVEHLKQWLRERLRWLDANLPTS